MATMFNVKFNLVLFPFESGKRNKKKLQKLESGCGWQHCFIKSWGKR